MRKQFLLLVFFCTCCAVHVEAQFGPAVAEFELLVPSNYNNDTQIDVSAKKAKLEKTTYSWNPNLTSVNFSKVTDKLVPGKTYLVKIFPTVNNLTTSETFLSFLKNQNALLVGAQGLTLVYDLAKEKLPTGKWVVSFDKKDNLWVDQTASNAHCVPFIRIYEEGEYAFDLNYLEYGWGINRCVLCLYDK